ncbi:MAG: hypothetical protein LBV17_05320 [Treponema sp.]|jgi:hypothetical protein|nr:hypothetical protein [Treponema sp.]
MKNFILVIICFFSFSSVFAQTENTYNDDIQTNEEQNDNLKNSYPALKLDLPLFDLPYQIDAMNTVGHGFFSSYANPSMAQSLALTLNIFSSFQFGMKYFYDNSGLNETLKKIIYYIGTGLGEFIFIYMPGGSGWLHEEYHRAVLTRFGANSFNGMNLFPIGASVIYVSNVKDEDLSRIKKESPPDLIRIYEAGIEGQYLLIERLQRNNFFYNQNFLSEYTYWYNAFNSFSYVWLSSMAQNGIDLNETETSDSRDFAGVDFTAWVYDLFRSNEAYEDRGIHPSGEGVNRYRTTTNLTEAEINYLRLQGYLQILNFMSPMMFGVKSLPMGEFDGNFAMRHYLTSFGMDISANVYLKKKPFNIVFIFHNYANYTNWFPAIEAELIDYPLTIGKLNMYLSPRVLIGMQPENQVFKTASPEFLGLFSLRVDFNVSKYFLPYVDFVFKTNGWVAGNELLKANASVRAGTSFLF